MGSAAKLIVGFLAVTGALAWAFVGVAFATHFLEDRIYRRQQRRAVPTPEVVERTADSWMREAQVYQSRYRFANEAAATWQARYHTLRLENNALRKQIHRRAPERSGEQ